jgi:cytochrome c biogenesis protein CcdA
VSGEAFLAASMIVSFLAGIVALAMPCCFSVLLPSYFASCFKRRSAFVGMTILFAAGIATVLLPIALGVTAISIYIGLNHSLLFVIGGFFMLFLGAASVLGVQLMPMFNPNVDLQKLGAPTVYVLGIFSGVASSCCAPVLAGILILTALTASFIGSLAVGLAYVTGMVFPLFLGAVLMDKSQSIQRVMSGKMFETRFGLVHSSRLFAAVIFFSMGTVTIVLGLTNNMLPTPGAALFNIYEKQIQDAVQGALGSAYVGAASVGAFALAAGYYLRRRFVRPPDSGDRPA